MNTNKTRFATLAGTVAAIAAFVAAAPCGLAQAITTSPLTGTVLTEDGRPIPGASVVVLHEPTGTAYQTAVRSDGTFGLRGLRPGGPYTVTVTGGGYPSVRREGVHLDLDRGAEVAMQMKADSVVQLEAFKVSASPLDTMFDSPQTGSGSYLSSQDIGELPAGDRSINALARLDPRISYNRDPVDQSVSANGMNNRYNSVLVDGVSASDPFGLQANNTAAERNVIPLDSLEALTVDTSPYHVRNAGFVGARINSITKSGSNQFKGSLYYTYRGRTVLGGQDMVGIDLDGVEYPLARFSEETTGFTLGGPIIPRKLFFFVSYEGVEEMNIPPSPAFRVDSATIAQVTNALTSLGFTPGNPNPPTGSKLTDDNVLAKLDWQVTSHHRATLRYLKTKSSRPTFPGFGTGAGQNNFSYDSHWYNMRRQNESYIGQWISRWSDRLNTELSYSRSRYASSPVNNSRQPYVQVRDIPVPGSSSTSYITMGTERSRHANQVEVETDTAEMFASYELTNAHTLQAGLQYEMADAYNLFVQDALGRYEFANLAQLLAVAARNDGTVQYRLFGYNQILPDVNAAAEFREADLGLFLNDVWRVHPRMKVEVGLRADRAGLPDRVPYNASFHAAFGVRNDHTYDGETILQPRLGFNWKPEGRQRTTVRGGVGLFYGRAPRVWIGNSYSNTGMNYRAFSAGTSGGGLPAPRVSADPNRQPITESVPPAQQVNFIDPGFQLPSRWKANLAVERALGVWDLKLTAEYQKTWVHRDVFLTNINLARTGLAPDGRELYWNAFGTSASGTRLLNNGFTNRTIQIGNTSRGRTDTLTLGLERARKRDGWFARLAYVNNRATDVLFGTSSVASSNWNNRTVFNSNAEEEGTSELEIRHKVVATVAKDLELIKGYRTTFSLFYEGRSGMPFSFITAGDVNGDGNTRNDLIYIPRRDGDPAVRFATPADRDRFFRIVDRFGLTEGAATARCSERYPWVNTFDFSIKQQIKLPGWRHRLVLGVDIMNVGNLLNDKWGLIRGSNQFFVKTETVANASYDGVNRQYVYSSVRADLAEGPTYAPALGRGEPAATRWSALFSARYEF